MADAIAFLKEKLRSWPSQLRFVRTKYSSLIDTISSPSWELVESIELLPDSNNTVGNHILPWFLQSDAFRNLRSITFGEDLSDESVFALIASPDLPKLGGLSLSLWDMSPDLWQRFNECAIAKQLQYLQMVFPPPNLGCPIDDSIRVIELGRFSRLNELSVVFPPKKLIPLLNSSVPSTLTSLELQLADPAQIEELAKSHHLMGQIRRLQLPSSKLDDKHLIHFLKTGHFNGVIDLGLQDNNVGPESIQALTTSGAAQFLRSLSLELNPLGVDGWMNVADGGFTALSSLNLDRTQAGDRGIQALTTRSDFAFLERLTIRGNDMGPDGSRWLGQCRWAHKLRELHLDDNPLGDEGLCALGATSELGNLQILSLRYTGAAARGFQSLLTASCARLETLLLNGGEFGNAELSRISDSSFAHSLHHLSLSGCKLGNVGAAKLSTNCGLPNLRILEVAVNDIDGTGCVALHGSTFFGSLWVLDMAHNRFGDTVLKSAQATCAGSDINEIHLEGDSISMEALEDYLKMLPLLKILTHESKVVTK